MPQRGAPKIEQRVMTALRKRAARAVLVLISLVVALIAAEIALRIAYPLRLRPKGDAPLFASRTYRLSADQDLVYEFRPNTRATVNGLEFEINASGFRDKRYPLNAAKDQRVVCVGDSLTYGWLVPLRATYHKQLEQLLKAGGRDIEVMGMGVVGYNIVQEYVLIRDKIPRLKPSLVLLQIGPNDFERTVGIKTVPETGKLVLIPYHDLIIPYMTAKTGLTRFLMRRSHLFRIMNLGFYGLKKKRSPDFVPADVFMMGEDTSFRYLDKIKSLLDAEAIPLAVAIFPFRGGAREPYLYAALTRRIHDRLDVLRIPYLDLFDRLNADPPKDIWIDGLHFNEEGYGIIAAELQKFIGPLLAKKKQLIQN
jgi:lysophospholipase L1-like esterase